MTAVVSGDGQSSQLSSQCLTQVEGYLWPNGFRRDIWMIVDAARDPQIYSLLLSCFYSRHSCLFSGTLAPELQLAAPYLVQLEQDDEKTRRFISRAWANSWGVFVKCDTRIETLRRHLRTILVVRDENGNRLMFRFYDPRILRTYLPTCTAGELGSVFGPIEYFFTEDERPDTLLEFCVNESELSTTKLSLDQGSRTAHA